MRHDERVSLPLLARDDEPRIARRGLLALGVVACGAAACRADADIGPLPFAPGQPGDDADTSGGDDVDTTGDDVDTTGDDVPVAPPSDDGVEPMRDAGMTGGPDVQSAPDVPVARDVPTAPDVQPMCMPSGTSVGSVGTFASGTWTLLRSPQAIVAHDAGGLYAYSSVCTHSGCIVNRPSASGQTLCACHGSVFDGNGAVVNGPARSPLVHYAVTVCMGTVYVNTSMHVAAGTRAAPTG